MSVAIIVISDIAPATPATLLYSPLLGTNPNFIIQSKEKRFTTYDTAYKKDFASGTDKVGIVPDKDFIFFFEKNIYKKLSVFSLIVILSKNIHFLHMTITNSIITTNEPPILDYYLFYTI